MAVTSGAASNVLVDLELYDPSGAKVAQQVWDAQAFSAGQRRTFSMNWSAPSGAPLGSYTIRAGVFRPAWAGLLHWNGSAGSLSVTAASAPTATPTPTAVPTQVTQPGFTSSATVAPASVARGAPVTIAAAVRSQTAAAALIDVEVYNAAGVKVAQQVWDSQSFAAGQQRTFSFAWTPPGNAATGSYTVKIGVFGPGWSPLQHWNNSASTFSVT